MTSDAEYSLHDHVFLSADHQQSERRAWAVIALCGAMMFAEIIGGLLFGSIALVADGMHMSTHAGALLLAAIAYSYSRKHANDPRFTFGTGKLGDLAGFTSAIVLAMIALLIGYDSINRIFTPVPIHFAEAIPIAVLGLGVNVASAWLLSGGSHHHHHHHDDAHDHQNHGDAQDHHDHDHHHHHDRDHNMRAAVVHVMADAAVSVIVILGLTLARLFGWLWMDPVAGLVGALVIASWSYSLIRDTAAILLDMNPDRQMADELRRAIESGGDRLGDLHLWRLGPGHLGAIVSVITTQARSPNYYRNKLTNFPSLSHLTIEVEGPLPPMAN